MLVRRAAAQENMDFAFLPCPWYDNRANSLRGIIMRKGAAVAATLAAAAAAALGFTYKLAFCEALN